MKIKSYFKYLFIVFLVTSLILKILDISKQGETGKLSVYFVAVLFALFLVASVIHYLLTGKKKWGDSLLFSFLGGMMILLGILAFFTVVGLALGLA